MEERDEERDEEDSRGCEVEAERTEGVETEAEDDEDDTGRRRGMCGGEPHSEGEGGDSSDHCDALIVLSRWCSSWRAGGGGG